MDVPRSEAVRVPLLDDNYAGHPEVGVGRYLGLPGNSVTKSTFLDVTMQVGDGAPGNWNEPPLHGPPGQDFDFSDISLYFGNGLGGRSNVIHDLDLSRID